MSSLLFADVLLGLLLALVILRADVRRRENRLLAVAMLIDVGRAAAKGLLAARGVEISSALPTQACTLGRVLLIYPLLEFAYAFPLARRPPAWLRIVGGLSTLAAASLVLLPATAAWAWRGELQLLYFVPFFVVIVGALRESSRRLERGDAEDGQAVRDVTHVLLALSCRFAAEIAVQVVVRELSPELLDGALTIAIWVTMLSYLVVANVVLRYRYFRLRRVLTEGFVYAVLSLSGLGLLLLVVEVVASRVPQPWPRNLCFAALLLIPVAVWRIAQRYAQRLEAALLCPFDPERRALRSVLERTLHESAELVEPSALVALTQGAIANLSRGRVALWSVACSGHDGWQQRVQALPLPTALAQHMATQRQTILHRRALEQLPDEVVQAFLALGADAIVAVRAQGELVCAFAIRCPALDRDMLATARVLADNLGIKLSHHVLYERAFALEREIDASRRLVALGSFAAAIAHDIRTPLTSVKMNLQMLRGYRGLDDDMRESTDIALEEVHRMNDYVSGILDYAKPVQLCSSETDLTHLIEETARTLQPLLEARKLALQCEVTKPGALPRVRADASRMKQVLVNLLENAADASAPGAVIRISADAIDREHVAIRVSDQGHGIAAVNLSKVFEPFFTTRKEGTGLGLAIVNKLVRAHDGEVRVDSSLGSGSTFTVLLPA